MAIVQLLPDSDAANNKLTVPQTLAAPNRSNFTTLYPEHSVTGLLRYTEGYPWEVNFYGQILNTVNSLTHVDPSLPALSQPYFEALGVVIQVSTPLSVSYDEVTAVTTITGSAIMPFGMKPNVGDLFVAQVDTGEDAYFMLTSVQRKTHRKDTLYEVSYTLYQYASADPTFAVQLKARVQETYYFNKEGKTLNQDVLITPSAKEAQVRATRLLAESMHHYFDMFVQREAGTLLLPGTEETCFDPLLTRFIAKTVPYDVLQDTRLYHYTVADRYYDQKSIFDLLMTRNQHLHVTINKTYGFIKTSAFRNYSRFGTIFHAGITNILYPINPKTATDIAELSLFSPIVTFESGHITLRNNVEDQSVVQTTNNDALFTKLLLPSMFAQDSYVVGPAFYDYLSDNTLYDQVSFVEILIARFIKREVVSVKDLVIVLERYERWSLLQQFYLLPVVWLLLANSL